MDMQDDISPLRPEDYDRVVSEVFMPNKPFIPVLNDRAFCSPSSVTPGRTARNTNALHHSDPTAQESAFEPHL
jgi:hypothetical protein